MGMLWKSFLRIKKQPITQIFFSEIAINDIDLSIEYLEPIKVLFKIISSFLIADNLIKKISIKKTC